MPRKRKKLLLGLLILLLIALACLIFPNPVYHLYREVSYFFGEPTAQEQQVRQYAHSRGISYGEYPEDLIGLLETNPETEDFVLNYPFRETEDPDITGLPRVQPPHFLQWDTRWGYSRYGSSYLAVTGCGPTCLAMAGYYLTGESTMRPDLVAEFAEKNGYYEKGYGSSWTLISRGGVELGLTVEELPLVKKKMTNALEAGDVVILALGPGDFTSAGHYILLTAVEDGAFRVNDPNSILRSNRLWSYEQLEGQIRNIWRISAGNGEEQG